ncbi:exoribonuclease II [Buchnera aphidicola]|uniref:exoribonuclease II n=1 Tax=Buchnera aphidicola TaxID=9 RepID=UPI0031B6AFCF
MAFQNNLVLMKLKKKMILKNSKIEGIVKSTSKNYGFLETNIHKKIYISSIHMKNLMHGDRIKGYVNFEKKREMFYPEILIEPYLTKFIGFLQKKKKKYFIKSIYPYVRNIIFCNSIDLNLHPCHEGDWVVAKLVEHRFKKNNRFYAIILKFIIKKTHPLIPWYVILERYNLQKKSPNMYSQKILEIKTYQKNRQDLTNLDFITIDNKYTKDIDDAIFIEEKNSQNLILTVAISDPTEYIFQHTPLDKIANQRSFTHYLPGFNIPMLPRNLSEDLCSLKPFLKRPALVCRVLINIDGSISFKNISFFLAWIKSKSKLSYENVSNWLEKKGTWNPENKKIMTQILLLKKVYDIRRIWRNKFAFIFPDKPEFRFHFSDTWKILNISLEFRRIAHYMIEEVMITVNLCAAEFLSKKLGFGLYNVHLGFDEYNAINVCKFLQEYKIYYNPTEIMTLKGFCQMRRDLKKISNTYIQYRLYKFQTFSEISLTPKPHYILGFPVYATWTSPIRKYSDIINHRLLKSIIKGEKNILKPDTSIITQISSQKRKKRLANRELEAWLYVNFFNSYNYKKKIFQANIVNIFKNGIQAQLLKNGAFVIIPSCYIYHLQKKLFFFPERGMIYLKNKIYYRVSDNVKVYIVKIVKETKKIIASII